jgi:OmpA-OmpF porin, OOP family
LLLFGIEWANAQVNTYSIYNAGEAVNTKYDEINPIISPDGKTLFFTRISHPENTLQKRERVTYDIWYSTKDSLGFWTEAQHMPLPFNQRKINGIEAVSSDGTTIYVRGAFNGKRYLGNGVSVCNLTPKGWSEPQQMVIKKFRRLNKGYHSNYFISKDSKKLLMSFSRVDNSKVNDIFISFLRKDSVWSKPRKITGPISTKQYNEMSPFLASDNRTLYFSSDRPGGKGDHDIWFSRRLKNSWVKWSEPIPLDSPINTAGYEAFYSVDAKGEIAYITNQDSVRYPKANADVAFVYLKEEFRPEPVALFNGYLKDFYTNEPIDGSLSFYYKEDNEHHNDLYSNDGTGKLRCTLPLGNVFTSTVKSEGYLPFSFEVDLVSTYNFFEIHKTIKAVPYSRLKGLTDNPRRLNILLRNAKLYESPLDSNKLTLKISNSEVYDLFRVNDNFFSVLRTLDINRTVYQQLFNDRYLTLMPLRISAKIPNKLLGDVYNNTLLTFEKVAEDTFFTVLPNTVSKILFVKSDKSEVHQNTQTGDYIYELNAEDWSSMTKIPLRELDIPNEQKFKIANKVMMNNFFDESGKLSIELDHENIIVVEKGPESYFGTYYQIPKVDIEEEADFFEEITTAQKMSVGNTLKLDRLLFDFGKSIIKSESFPELDKLAVFMIEHPTMEILLTGHTDNIGTIDENIDLSRQRALAVKNYLVTKGVNGKRIIYQGLGPLFPVSEGTSAYDLQLNRRVELTVIRR